eukprot:4750297-Pleurochrysis_carterae.AAC.1
MSNDLEGGRGVPRLFVLFAAHSRFVSLCISHKFLILLLSLPSTVAHTPCNRFQSTVSSYPLSITPLYSPPAPPFVPLFCIAHTDFGVSSTPHRRVHLSARVALQRGRARAVGSVRVRRGAVSSQVMSDAK